MPQRREIIRRELERVEEVVDVLDVDDGPQPAQRSADPLPEDRRLAYARVGDAQRPVLLLQALVHKVDVPEPTDVLAKNDDPRVAREVRIETAQEDEAAIDRLRLRRILGRHARNAQRRSV